MLTILFSSLAFAGADQAEYTRTYGTRIPDAAQQATLSACLQAWGDHPFSDLSTTPVRVIGTSVRVMGFGSTEPVDVLQTDYPQLVLIKPTTSVMTRTTYQLTNKNGWYCFDTPTTVLGQSRVNLDCSARLASSRTGQVVVVGSDSSGSQGGVIVLGAFEVNRVNCAEGR